MKITKSLSISIQTIVLVATMGCGAGIAPGEQQIAARPATWLRITQANTAVEGKDEKGEFVVARCEAAAGCDLKNAYFIAGDGDSQRLRVLEPLGDGMLKLGEHFVFSDMSVPALTGGVLHHRADRLSLGVPNGVGRRYADFVGFVRADAEGAALDAVFYGGEVWTGHYRNEYKDGDAMRRLGGPGALDGVTVGLEDGVACGSTTTTWQGQAQEKHTVDSGRGSLRFMAGNCAYDEAADLPRFE